MKASQNLTLAQIDCTVNTTVKDPSLKKKKLPYRPDEVCYFLVRVGTDRSTEQIKEQLTATSTPHHAEDKVSGCYFSFFVLFYCDVGYFRTGVAAAKDFYCGDFRANESTMEDSVNA